MGLASASMIYACSKNFLDVAPVGTLNPDILANEKGVQGLLVGAYSILDGQGGNNGGWGSAISNWVYGSVCADDAYKGSTPDDQGDIVPLETWSANPANSYPSQKWDVNYDGIQRANQVLRVSKLATDIPDDELADIEAEARFLRGFYHFELKKVFNNVPYVDESISDTSSQASVSNVDGSGNYVNIWPQIEADFSFAMQNLPETQPQVGRANKWAAQAFLAKVYLFQGKYDDAKPLLEDLIANGQTSDGLKYDLINFGSNFNPAQNHKNDAEAVFSVQMAVNDGSGDAQNIGQGISNGNYGDALNFPYGAGPGACCGFFNPSQDLANAYKTDANGLPLFDTYNQGNRVSDPTTPYTGTLDPRIDWTIGRKGVPYLDWGPHPGDSWIRDPVTNGHFNPKKNVYAKSQQGSLSSTEAFWAAVELVANNVNVIRFSDVLLMAAEAEVKSSSPDLNKALTYVNRVRTRAADPDGWVYAGAATYSASSATYSDHSVPADNYKVGTYSSFPDADYAMKAIMFERKLELAMEGHRFFDLVRWGIAAQVLNAYATYTKTINPLYKDISFTAGKNEYFAIPQDQIDILGSFGTKYLKQNPGY
jgi:hypothetical protein